MGQNVNPFSLLTNVKFYAAKNALKKNLSEIKPIYENLKTSFGPLGLDKMCVDNAGNMFITNDGATIIRNMILESSVAKILMSLANEQDRSIGDGTTSVVLLAYHLIEAGTQLICEENVEPTVVVNGYRMAFAEIVRIVREWKKDNAYQHIQGLIETSIASKILNEDKQYFSELIQEVVKKNLHDITIMKSIGGSICDTKLCHGLILNCRMASELMATRFTENRPCRVLLCDFGLLKEKLPLNVNINANVTELEIIRQKEIELTRQKCQAIINVKPDLVLLTGGLDEICVKMFIEANISAVRRVHIDELRILNKQMIHTTHEGLTFNSCIEIDSYEQQQYGDYKLVHLSCSHNTILVRGPNHQICDEVQRSLNDAIEVIRNSKEESVLPGGGATENILYKGLLDYGSKLDMKEYIAILKYAESLKELVCILCENAGLSGEEVFGKILSSSIKNVGVNLINDIETQEYTIQDNLSAGIVEPTSSKLRALKTATEAAISILRINEIIEFE